jgi:acetyl-CoA C-acetyltransferase
VAALPDSAVAILSATRTPIGKFGGSLRGFRAPELGIIASRAAIERAGLAPPEIQEVLFGHGIQAGAGQNPARQVLRGVGIPDHVGASTVNMVCGSGLKAIHFATQAIRSGDFDRILVGGMESMSNAPYLIPGTLRWGSRPGPHTMDDAMQRDSLIDAYEDHELMGMTGERIARKLGISRAEADAFGVRSNRLAVDAISSGAFAAEVVPGGVASGGPVLDHDEIPRADTTAERLAELPPAFVKDGILTAGNSSKLADGASALVLASRDEVRRRRAQPLAWIHSTGEGGVHPRDVMEAPIPTVREHLKRAGVSPTDFDRVEHNEAYATASLAVQRAFGFTESQFNVHGGAVALGHPIGSSGARIVVTLVHELARTGGHRGLATLCMGGGNGLSTIVIRPES